MSTMLSLLKSPNYVFAQASKNWRHMFSGVFCCTRPDPLLSPKRNSSYETFDYNKDNDEEEVLVLAEDRQEILPSRPSSLHVVQSIIQQQPDVNKNFENDICISPTTFNHLSKPTTPQCTPKLLSPTILSPTLTPKTLINPQLNIHDCQKSPLHTSAISAAIENEFTKFSIIRTSAKNTEEDGCKSPQFDDCSTSGISSGMSQPSSMEFESENQCLDLRLVNEEQLNAAINRCNTSPEILLCLKNYTGDMTTLLAISSIHNIYLRALNEYQRNSPEYNRLCGRILTNQNFRNLISLIQQNLKSLNNFALLTTASDLLYLRLTLKNSTIPSLLSHVNYETLDLDELRLLAMCLHTPNIPLLNSEYLFNVSAARAMKYLNEMTDLYTILLIMKTFGRYFSISAKRKCESCVYRFAHDLTSVYPDGRSMAAHMFDAFYRMEYSPSLKLLQMASEAITSKTVPIQPQDISATLRYFVKFGYNIRGREMLMTFCDDIKSRLPHYHVNNFITQIKWLTVFYHYDHELMQMFVKSVINHMKDLDFVALSDVVDSMAQVYFLPNNEDLFFDHLYEELLQKLTTLSTSHVKNVQRKLILTAFHFAVFGRYPVKIIRLAITQEQIMGNIHKGSYLEDLCRTLSIERPDLLPNSVPQQLLRRPSVKLYKYEQDVNDRLCDTVGYENFNVVSSPIGKCPVFLIHAKLDGSILQAEASSNFIPAHMHQTVQNIAVVPLPRFRFCRDSRHGNGKTRLVLRLLRAQGARVVTVPHFEWDGTTNQQKSDYLARKIFDQKTDDLVE